MAVYGGLGSLNRWVEIQENRAIQEPGKNRNEYNEQPAKWETVASRWAAIEPLNATESLAANQVQAFRTLKVRFRRFKGLAAGKHRLRYTSDGRERLLNIEEVLDIDERAEEQRLRVSEKA